MFIGLKPLELVYLMIAIGIVAQQLIVRKGAFDPVAFAAIAFFVGLIPVGRADKHNDDLPPSRKLGSTMKKALKSGDSGDDDR